ncbi:hypothetical protein TSAR_000594 [Trichomalopsis sarcophagae]|uniref:Transposase Tc1-like domain-containing protein n=1 Tax=Trichomalopsis sarcophagae TaxID=543379 RepID=A0A232EHK6_9HYME|nr:hypothetical protein TSAR_000594 [Trichomalopsis sarcophagae]
MSIDHSSSDLGAFAKECTLKIDFSELVNRSAAAQPVVHANRSTASRETSNLHIGQEHCCFFVYKNPSPVSSKMLIDRLSSAFVAFAENQQRCFFFVYKNPSPVSSEMLIDRLSSAFVAFVNKCALKTDYLELVNRSAAAQPVVHGNRSTASRETSVDCWSFSLGAFAKRCFSYANEIRAQFIAKRLLITRPALAEHSQESMRHESIFECLTISRSGASLSTSESKAPLPLSARLFTCYTDRAYGNFRATRTSDGLLTNLAAAARNLAVLATPSLLSEEVSFRNFASLPFTFDSRLRPWSKIFLGAARRATKDGAMFRCLCAQNNNVLNASRMFLEQYPYVQPQPSRPSYYRLLERVRQHGVIKVERRRRVQPVRGDQNLSDRINQALTDNPRLSLRALARQFTGCSWNNIHMFSLNHLDLRTTGRLIIVIKEIAKKYCPSKKKKLGYDRLLERVRQHGVIKVERHRRVQPVRDDENLCDRINQALTDNPRLWLRALERQFSTRMFLEQYPHVQPQPSRPSYYRLLERVRQHGVIKVERRRRVQPVRGDQNLSDRINQALTDNPRLSLRALARQFNVSKESVRRIVRMTRRPYKPTKAYCKWDLRQLARNPHFFRRVCFRDESTFTNKGPINKQVTRMWSEQNQHWFIENDRQHRWKFNVWIGIVGGRIIAL